MAAKGAWEIQDGQLSVLGARVLPGTHCRRWVIMTPPHSLAIGDGEI